MSNYLYLATLLRIINYSLLICLTFIINSCSNKIDKISIKIDNDNLLSSIELINKDSKDLDNNDFSFSVNKNNINVAYNDSLHHQKLKLLIKPKKASKVVNLSILKPNSDKSLITNDTTLQNVNFDLNDKNHNDLIIFLSDQTKVNFTIEDSKSDTRQYQILFDEISSAAFINSIVAEDKDLLYFIDNDKQAIDINITNQNITNQNIIFKLDTSAKSKVFLNGELLKDNKLIVNKNQTSTLTVLAEDGVTKNNYLLNVIFNEENNKDVIKSIKVDIKQELLNNLTIKYNNDLLEVFTYDYSDPFIKLDFSLKEGAELISAYKESNNNTLVISVQNRIHKFKIKYNNQIKDYRMIIKSLKPYDINLIKSISFANDKDLLKIPHINFYKKTINIISKNDISKNGFIYLKFNTYPKTKIYFKNKLVSNNTIKLNDDEILDKERLLISAENGLVSYIYILNKKVIITDTTIKSIKANDDLTIRHSNNPDYYLNVPDNYDKNKLTVMIELANKAKLISKFASGTNSLVLDNINNETYVFNVLGQDKETLKPYSISLNKVSTEASIYSVQNFNDNIETKLTKEKINLALSNFENYGNDIKISLTKSNGSTIRTSNQEVKLLNNHTILVPNLVDNQYNISIVAEDGKTYKNYTINVINRTGENLELPKIKAARLNIDNPGGIRVWLDDNTIKISIKSQFFSYKGYLLPVKLDLSHLSKLTNYSLIDNSKTGEIKVNLEDIDNNNAITVTRGKYSKTYKISVNINANYENLVKLSDFFNPSYIGANNDYIFVSNQGDPKKDNDGFISLISHTGQIINSQFIKRLDNPKGLYASDNLIYITDNDKLKVFNIESKLKVREYNFDNYCLQDVEKFRNLLLLTDSCSMNSYNETNAGGLLLFGEASKKIRRIDSINKDRLRKPKKIVYDPINNEYYITVDLWLPSSNNAWKPIQENGLFKLKLTADNYLSQSQVSGDFAGISLLQSNIILTSIKDYFGNGSLVNTQSNIETQSIGNQQARKINFIAIDLKENSTQEINKPILKKILTPGDIYFNKRNKALWIIDGQNLKMVIIN